MTTKAKTLTTKDIEFNRWCIEMAMKWPVVTAYGSAQGYSAGGGLPTQQVDADVLGRAHKIKAWVNG